MFLVDWKREAVLFSYDELEIGKLEVVNHMRNSWLRRECGGYVVSPLFDCFIRSIFVHLKLQNFM
jgi:hypothetical protein